MNRHTQVLCILDGWGISEETAFNPIVSTPTPHWDALVKASNFALLEASGRAVGLPEGQMGNSEVGHLTIGAGRVIDHDLVRINKATAADTLKNQPHFQAFVRTLRQKKSIAHVMGLFSPGGVHSHSDHIIHVIKCLHDADIAVCLHIFLDGRDTPPTSAKDHLTAVMNANPVAFEKLTLASISGRFYAMDRDNRWARTHAAYAAIAEGQPMTNNTYTDPREHIEKQYAHGVTDEFIEPAVHSNYKGISANDGIFVCNFRADRMRQLVSALALPDFTSFARNHRPTSLLAGMAPYAETLNPYLLTIFPSLALRNTLGEICANAHKSQFRLAETEKYAHVTYFFNGGRESPFSAEERRIIASPAVETYDLNPEMSADELTGELEKRIKTNKYDLIIVNYANPDMVGHTGNEKATSKAIACVDTCLGRIDAVMRHNRGNLFITADHGNAEKMFDPDTHQPHTAHTTARVPFAHISYGDASHPRPMRTHGTLADIAPTILDLMGLATPTDMTGTSLFLHED